MNRICWKTLWPVVSGGGYLLILPYCWHLTPMNPIFQAASGWTLVLLCSCVAWLHPNPHSINRPLQFKAWHATTMGERTPNTSADRKPLAIAFEKIWRPNQWHCKRGRQSIVSLEARSEAQRKLCGASPFVRGKHHVAAMIRNKEGSQILAPLPCWVFSRESGHLF